MGGNWLKNDSAAIANRQIGEIQPEIIDTSANRCQYRHQDSIVVCKDQQEGFMHSFMHFAPQLAGDK